MYSIGVFGLYSIGLVSTQSVWPVLYGYGLYYICLACTLLVYRFGLYSIGLASTLSVWPVLYRFGLYSIGLVCTLSFWPVLYRSGLYSISLSVWPVL